MSIRRGLPDNFSTRHDQHYVDSLSEPMPETIGILIDVSKLKPNSDQPRNNVGDLSGLKDSIREKGIIEPLIVKRDGEGYLIISGERRFRASVELGLDKLPCIVRDSDQMDTLEIALIENLQRKDLSSFEEADGLRRLADEFGLTHDEIAGKIGKSRTTITESITLSYIPEDIRLLCVNNGITAKTMLLQIAREETHAEMLALTQEIIERGLSRNETRAARKPNNESRPKPFTFRQKATDGSFVFNLKFKKSEVSKEELIQTVRSILEKLETAP